MKAKPLYLGVCAMVFIAALGAWLSTLYFDFTINMTQSLPGTLYVIHKGGSFEKNDLVAYRWPGGATYPTGAIFIKQVTGFPGDTVKRHDRLIWVNEQYIGMAKPVSKAGVPLSPASPGTIPKGTYFMSTPSPDSLDSRYAISGNVMQSAIIGKAYAIF
jgi:conjugal transfer pilin signal peptidase TrbI